MRITFAHLVVVTQSLAWLATGCYDYAPDAHLVATQSPASLGTRCHDYAPELLIDLPVTCNTPDGMRLDSRSGDIILSCPNFFSKTGDVFDAPPALMRITPANQLEPYFSELPPPGNLEPIPDRAAPMGLDFGPDGNLYVADHQYRYDPNYKSRLIRVNIDAAGVPMTADVVVKGFRLANAAMWSRGYLYVSDTFAFEEGGKSAIYRFTLAELEAATTDNPIMLQKPTDTSTDPHLFAQFVTIPDRGLNLAGADGITFDNHGNLYTGNFGDGVMTKIAIDDDGNKGETSTFVMDPGLTCVDGIVFDAARATIYVADSQRNAIQAVSRRGRVTTLWENDDTDGTDGLLDQPAEPLIRGNDLIIANFDSGFAVGQPGKNTSHDPPHTISVIHLGAGRHLD
jgi:sugar lactone lactonase YvrE